MTLPDTMDVYMQIEMNSALLLFIVMLVSAYINREKQMGNVSNNVDYFVS